MHSDRCLLYESGEMSPAESAEFEMHLGTCEECRAWLEAARAAHGWADAEPSGASGELSERCVRLALESGEARPMGGAMGFFKRGDRRKGKEKKAGAPPIPAGRPGVGEPPPGAFPGLRPPVSTSASPMGGFIPGVLGSARSGGFGSMFLSALRSPAMIGLIMGATAVGGGYAIVLQLSDMKDGTKPSSGIRVPGRAQDGALLPPESGGGDSLQFFNQANKGAFGESAAAGASGGSPDAADAIQSASSEGSAAGESMPGAENAPGGDLMERLAESMRKEKGEKEEADSRRLVKSGGTEAPRTGGAGSTSASMGVAGQGSGALASAAKGGVSRPMAQSSARSARIGRSGGAGATSRSALDQARNARDYSKFAVGQGDAGKYTAGIPFDAGSGAGASSIGGDGAGLDRGGVGNDTPAANPAMSGGPMGGPTAAGETPVEEKEDLKPKNVTPYQAYVNLAQTMILLAAIFLALSYLAGLFAKKFPILLSWAKGLAFAAMAFAGIATLMGMMIMLQGQTTQGTIFTVVGALLTVLSYTAWTTADARAAAAEPAAQQAAQPLSQEAGKQAATNVVSGAGGGTAGGAGGVSGGAGGGTAGAGGGTAGGAGGVSGGAGGEVSGGTAATP